MIVLVDENMGIYTSVEKISTDDVLITVKGILDEEIYFQFRMSLVHYNYISKIKVQ